MNNVATPGNLADGTGVISGDPQAANATIGINSTAVGVANLAQASRTTAVGFKNTADPAYSVAVGYRNRCTGGSTNSVAMGRSNFTSDTSLSACAIGVMNNVATPGNLADATGVISGDPQTFGTVGINSSAVGVGCNAQALRSHAFGFKAIARIIDTVVINGQQIIRKDNGEAAGDWVKYFVGPEVYYLSGEIDLKVIADQTITLPAGMGVFINEVGIIATDIGTVTTQPTVRFGITGTPAKYVAAAVTTALTASNKRQSYQRPLLADDREASLVGGVTVGATTAAGNFLGRFYFKVNATENE
jgi:hypothetical protein